MKHPEQADNIVQAPILNNCEIPLQQHIFDS